MCQRAPDGDAWTNACTAFNLDSRKFSNISSTVLDVPRAQWGLHFTALRRQNVCRQILHKTKSSYDSANKQCPVSDICSGKISGLTETLTVLVSCWFSLFIRNINKIWSSYLLKTKFALNAWFNSPYTNITEEAKLTTLESPFFSFHLFIFA